MILKNAHRFSERIMLVDQGDDPQKCHPAL